MKTIGEEIRMALTAWNMMGRKRPTELRLSPHKLNQFIDERVRFINAVSLPRDYVTAEEVRVELRRGTFIYCGLTILEKM